MSLVSAISRNHWAITPDGLRIILAVASRQNDDLKAVAEREGVRLENTRKVEHFDGVAVIPLEGPLFRKANLFTEVSGATSYQMFATDFTAALNDPKVHSIVVNVNSPGGSVDGCHETAELIYAARGKKPIVAYVDGMACSAAYWIASACDRIVADETAITGSIGVVATMTDASEALAKQGVEQLTVVSSNAPDKIHGYDGITDEAKNALLATLNSLESSFVSTVARNRGVTTDIVLANYGRGGVRVAGHSAGEGDARVPSGIEAGLVDEIGGFAALVGELRADAEAETRRGPVLPGASAEAIFDCKVVRFESHGKPIEGKWDASAATKRVRKWASSDGSGDWAKVDKRKYERAFLFVKGDGSKEGDYAEPHHDLVNGRLVTVKRGVEAAAARINQVKGISEAERAEGKRHLARHYHEWGGTAPWEKKDKQKASAESAPQFAPRAEEPMATEKKDDKDLSARMDALESRMDECHAESMDAHRATQDKLAKLDDKDEEHDKKEEDEEAKKAASALAPEIVALTGKTGAEALGVIAAWKKSHDDLPGVRAELASLKGAAEAKERGDLVNAMLTSGQLKPAQKSWADAQSIGTLRAYEAATPKGEPVREPPIDRPAGSPDAKVVTQADVPTEANQRKAFLMAQFKALPDAEQKQIEKNGSDPIAYMERRIARTRADGTVAAYGAR